MATTDAVSAALVGEMDRLFNDPDAPPPGGVVGPTQLRPGMGLPALDGFDECALAWVMSGVRGKTETFPAMSDAPGCRGRTIVEFSVGVARCSVALGYDGQLPTVEEMEAEYALQEDDKDRLAAATCRAAKQLEDGGYATNVALLPIETYGPEGGTVAVYRTIMIELGKRR